MKTPQGYTHAKVPAGLMGCLSFKLKTGWRFDRRRGQFVSSDGQRLTVRKQLPKGSKIVPAVPPLAEAESVKLSDAERDLVRYFQLILPKGATPEPYLQVVKSWDAVTQATVSPQVSLPQ